MRRREVIILLGGAVAMWPLAPRAQQPAVPIVGFLSWFPDTGQSHGAVIFRKALGDAGYVDGRNVAIEYRSADGQSSRLPSLAAELVAERVAVIVATPFDVGFAATAATAKIPIIFTIGSGPTTLESLGRLIRPDGNITGVSQVLPPLAPKRLAIIRELMPDARIVAFLDDPGVLATHAPFAPSEFANVSAAAQPLGMKIERLQPRTNDELDEAFRTLTRQRTDALIVSPHPLFIAARSRLVALAQLHAVPTIYPFSEDAEAGGLMSYGNSNFDIFRQMGRYAARILDGERPGDLPIAQPATISLTINMKTAGELGLAVPQSLLARADRVITASRVAPRLKTIRI